MSEAKDTYSRKWQLTLNNPIEKGLTHDIIKEKLANFNSLIYWCMGDEKGETYHTHLYIQAGTVIRFSAVKKAFPEAHMEMARGTAQENRDYISKEGKWEKDEKHGTKIEGTFEEWGEMPIERQGQRNDLHDLYGYIRAGFTNCEIYEQDANYIQYHGLIDRVRQDSRYEQNRSRIRQELQVIYIWGDTGVGKTRGVLEQHCINDVYRITEYSHPFDAYQGESVIVFDEFRSQLKIGDMLNYLDIYPVSLPSRYVNKQACYTTVYILSNEPLREQYPNVKRELPKTWEALMRRIHKLYEYTAEGRIERDKGEHLGKVNWERLTASSEPPGKPTQVTLREIEDDGELPQGW